MGDLPEDIQKRVRERLMRLASSGTFVQLTMRTREGFRAIILRRLEGAPADEETGGAPAPRVVYWICIGTPGRPDPALLAYSKTLAGKVPHGFSEVVHAGAALPALPRFTAYLAVSTDNPVDRVRGFGAKPLRERYRVLRLRAARLSAFLAQAIAFEKSYRS